jgi:hypothetical protein
VIAIARLTLRRLLRGRTLWVTALLLLMPILLAAAASIDIERAADRWSMVAEISFRSLVLLAPVVHLAGALGEETEGRTYTYLWSRPIRREAVILGKMLAVTPVLAVLAPAALAAGYAIVAAGRGASDPAWLLRAMPAAALGVVAASAFAVGLGALVPRHPLVAALSWVALAEQVLPAVRSVQNLSALYHVEVIADLPSSPNGVSGDPGGAALALVVLTAIWLGVALARVRSYEPGSADG